MSKKLKFWLIAVWEGGIGWQQNNKGGQWARASWKKKKRVNVIKNPRHQFLVSAPRQAHIFYT